jgi:DNA-binding beta-propeller fold protein YncE
LLLGIALLLILGAGTTWWVTSVSRQTPLRAQGKGEELDKAPELNGGVAWLNTAKPIKMADLKGKIVILDFWTLCCINCIHTLPDLAKLEKKYADQLVVIGVHSPKFENEKDTNSIRKAILRYEIAHPVVNDADQKIWNAYGCRSWPSLAVIDPEGNYLGQLSGEGNFDRLDTVITKLIDKHRKNKTLNETAIRFDTASFRDNPTALYFPGKVLADEKSNRLFIADSTNHRIVITDLEGNKIAIAGAGKPGKLDGPFAFAQFDDPQGMALSDGMLYVADRKNHCIRLLDLTKQTVKTIAGTGEQDRDRAEGGDALKRGLNSPWDLHLDGDLLYIAMAGHHQIWTMNLKTNKVEVYAGDGFENIKDGPLFAARFAQPSGLASDGKFLYVADCEVSAIRKVPKGGTGRVETLVGTGLFDFGDVDGVGKAAVLQHAIGVGYHEGTIYVADTYNSKIKTIDPKTLEVKSFLGGHDQEGWFTDYILNEPCGMTFANGKMYVADTNSHRIRVIDLKTKAISTLMLKGVEPPKVSK